MKKIILRVTLILVLGAGAVGAWIYRDLRTPIAHSKTQDYIEIPKGSSPSAILKRLTAEGVLKNSWPLAIYLKLTGGGARLKAGEYKFPSPISPLGVYAKLRQGERRLNRFTVIEGWTRWDIAQAMAAVPEFNLNNFDEALALTENIELVQDIDPKATNLEGYLFPDTYEFAPETTAADLITMMVKRFRGIWKDDWTTQALARHKTPREIVTIASLIETEAKLPEERPLVSSVIYNRLQINMPLGVDSTVIYAAKLEGKWRDDGKVYRSDVERRSLYNTRIYAGLPPGPIASPGRSSLEAALNPATTTYLYYVREPARNDGAHNFYTDESEFSKGVQALREWERQRDLKAQNQ